jgi:glyoxylase-like metal-dependent hydrolase (beta-lactamase superfamily II)
VRELPGLPPSILAIPLPGHSRGHACIAVDRGDRWLLHAGDAYFHPSRLRGEAAPFGLQLFERLVAMDYEKVLENHRRLGELSQKPGVTVFSAHDAGELAALRG